MANFKVGKNILENLTTGMYNDSRIIYREYIQNACDQIDIAVKTGLLRKEEAKIEIWIDSDDTRQITIKDNATGIPATDFKQTLGDIANSGKTRGESKGFRGIGRLAGLAYCKKLIFTSKYSGEKEKSLMICDAVKLRQMLNENTRYTLEDVWESVVEYDTENSDNLTEHFFQVELCGINEENLPLLNKEEIEEYLSFVAPLPYDNNFMFYKKIYDHAKEIGYEISEYHIQLNGKQLFKNYSSRLYDRSNGNRKTYDEIHDLVFKDFRKDDGSLIAWMWYGISGFEKQIPSENAQRGIRLRCSNIQIGGANTLSECSPTNPLFKEQRGNYYFVGEVFSVDKNLIPNSQRDYFNENETRIEFEDALRIYFYDELHKLYYNASAIKSNFKHIDQYEEKRREFAKGEFINPEQKQKYEDELEKSRQEAEKARKKLEKYSEEGDDPISIIYKIHKRKYSKSKENTPAHQQTEKTQYTTQKLSKLSRTERKTVSTILAIIKEETTQEIFERIQQRIIDALK